MIKFTSEMIEESIKQTIKRKDFITPNFKNPKMTQEQSDQIGFLGEFACCEFMGIDWKKISGNLMRSLMILIFNWERPNLM